MSDSFSIKNNSKTVENKESKKQDLKDQESIRENKNLTILFLILLILLLILPCVLSCITFSETFICVNNYEFGQIINGFTGFSNTSKNELLTCSTEVQDGVQDFKDTINNWEDEFGNVKDWTKNIEKWGENAKDWTDKASSWDRFFDHWYDNWNDWNGGGWY